MVSLLLMESSGNSQLAQLSNFVVDCNVISNGNYYQMANKKLHLDCFSAKIKLHLVKCMWFFEKINYYKVEYFSEGVFGYHNNIVLLFTCEEIIG